MVDESYLLGKTAVLEGVRVLPAGYRKAIEALYEERAELTASLIEQAAVIAHLIRALKEIAAHEGPTRRLALLALQQVEGGPDEGR